jgi:hypothetical protein
MFHRLNAKGDNSLTEIPGCPEKRVEDQDNEIEEEEINTTLKRVLILLDQVKGIQYSRDCQLIFS